VDVDAFVAIAYACDELQKMELGGQSRQHACIGGGGRSLRPLMWGIQTYTRWVEEEEGRKEEEGRGEVGKRRREVSWVIKRRSKTIRRTIFKTRTCSSNASSPDFPALTNPLLPLE